MNYHLSNVFNCSQKIAFNLENDQEDELLANIQKDNDIKCEIQTTK